MANRPYIIGICGAAGSGKDTVGNIIATTLANKELEVGITSLALPIKAMVMPLLHLYGIALEDLEDRSIKEKDLPDINVSPRRLLQTLGTDWARNQLGNDFWIKLLERRIGKSLEPQDVVVVTDIRFPNEAEWCDFLVQVVRPDAEKVAEHESEEPIPPELIDGTIVNDGGKEQLIPRAITVLASWEQLMSEEENREEA